MAEAQEQDKSLVVHHFQEAIIGPAYGVYDKTGHPITPAFLNRGNEGNDFPFGAPNIQEFFESELKQDPRPCLWIRFAVFWHFGHLITETLANLWPLLEPKKHLPDNFIVVIPDAFRQDIDKIKSLAGDAVVLCNGDLGGPTCFAQVLIAEPSCVDRSMIHPEHPHVLQVFRNWLFDNQNVSEKFNPDAALRPHDQLVKDKLYLSRSRLPTSFRKLIQEQQLEDQLIEAGWTILYPEKTSLEHQLELISEAKILAGQWGSAFHLLMACPEHQCEQVVMLTMDYGAEINFINQFQLQKISATFLPCLSPIGKKGGTLRDLRLSQSPSEIAEQIITSIGEKPKTKQTNEVDEQHSIELHPGRAFCTTEELNRISRQQGLCLAIAQASVYDEICQIIELPTQVEQSLVQAFLDENELNESTQLDHYLLEEGWSMQDLIYFATKNERLSLFQRRLFMDDVELQFLSRKTELDTVSYSLIRVRDGNLAFELHQRLIDGEASFSDLASTFSEGTERESFGKVGPVPLDQANPALVEKLRASQKDQLWKPFFVDGIWVILRLDELAGARLDNATRQHILQELFNEWLNNRTNLLLSGKQPDPLPLHRLKTSYKEVHQNNSLAVETTQDLTDIEDSHVLNDMEMRLREIIQSIREKDQNVASQKAEDLTRDYPDNRDVLLIANDAHRMNEDYDKAFDAAVKLIECHPEFFDGYTRAAQDALSLNKRDSAVEIIKKGLNNTPITDQSLLIAINICEHAKDFESFIKLGEQLRRRSPSSDNLAIINIITKTLRRSQRLEECRWHLYNSIQKITNRVELKHMTEEIYHLETQIRQKRAHAKQDGCDVLCIAADAAPYIHEFIHHYIYLGFKDIFIGVNNLSDQTLKIAQKIQTIYPQVKIVNVKRIGAQFQHRGCYHRLFDMALQQSNSKHCLIVDIDEFWIADPFPREIDQFIQNSDSFDAYSFHWIVEHGDKLFTKPFEKNITYIKDSHVTSMLRYSSPLAQISDSGPILNMDTQEAVARIGNSVNINILETTDGITVNNVCDNPQASTPEMKNQAWILRRTFRSELEFAAKAINSIVNNNDKSFVDLEEGRQHGWAAAKNCSEENMNGYIDIIMPSEDVEKYHLSLEEFIQTTCIQDDLDEARSKFSEQAIIDKLSSIESDVLSRNNEALRRIFSGTKYLEIIEAMIFKSTPIS